MADVAASPVAAVAIVDDAASALSTPREQIVYHVRLIDAWSSQSSSQHSFFGLQLELHGYRGTSSTTTGPPSSSDPDFLAGVIFPLDFTPSSRPRQHESLQSIAGPFQLLVASKMALESVTDAQRPLLQAMVPVQTHNQLDCINNINFLTHSRTGADVFHQLQRVLDHVDISKPFELTFLRHNHAQATAKIRPFAARDDVQQAQVVQFQKLEQDEAQWPQDRRKKKQFALQQMDFSREAYLYHHIGAQLVHLHDQIMEGGVQWHAYEFDKALWYYHVPTGKLFAEHPMRSNGTTRHLLGCVQFRTKMAAVKLQHGARSFLRRHRLVKQATLRLLELVSDEIMTHGYQDAMERWLVSQRQEREKAATSPSPEVSVTSTAQDSAFLPWSHVLYRVRLIDPWPVSSSGLEAAPSSLCPHRPHSFFGLQLELHGRGKDTEEIVVCPLEFSRPSQRESLESLVGPFQLVVVSKMRIESATDAQRPLLQAMVPVQTLNRLDCINNIHFLTHCKTGSDVVVHLQRVLNTVSVARPFQLTFLRHNHAQATAKIRPFAARDDVQQAQVVQFQKLEQDEAKWPQDRRKKKQFALQQMDFSREAYLDHHIGAQLVHLHDQIMEGGVQWHAYEFEKALWYYHVPTDTLFAEHPMRNNHETRQLIGCVQLRTRKAALTLQFGALQFLALREMADQAAAKLLERVADEIVAIGYEEAIESWLLLRRQQEEELEEAQTVIAAVGKTAALERQHDEEAYRAEMQREQEEEARAAAASVVAANAAAAAIANATAVATAAVAAATAASVALAAAAAVAVTVVEIPFEAPEQLKEDETPMLTESAEISNEQDVSPVPVAPPPVTARVALGPPDPVTNDPVAVVEEAPKEILIDAEPDLAAVDQNGNADDDGDDDDDKNWRSRLRLLKVHYQERRAAHHSKAASNKKYCVVAPLEPPVLLDRSSLLLDVVSEGSMKQLITSLRESNNPNTSSPWKRNGSFRSFHAFFTSSPSSSSSYALQESLDPIRINSPRLVLPSTTTAMASLFSSVRSDRESSSCSFSPANNHKLPSTILTSNIRPPPPTQLATSPWQQPPPHTIHINPTTSTSPLPSLCSPKKLPYIRKRNGKNLK